MFTHHGFGITPSLSFALHDKLARFRGFGGALCSYFGPIEVNARRQRMPVCAHQVPCSGVVAYGLCASFFVGPQQFPRHVEHFDGYIYGCVAHIVAYDEGGCGACRVFGGVYPDVVGHQSAHYMEVERHLRRIVLYVASSELQFMLTWRKRGNVEHHRACGVRTEVERKVVVKVVGFVHAAVDNQLHVMSDATTRCVQSIFIRNFGYEERLWRYVTPVCKRSGVEVTVYGGADRVVGTKRSTADGKAFAISVGPYGAFVVYGI